MKGFYLSLAATLIACLPLVTSTSTFLLQPHHRNSLYLTTRGYPFAVSQRALKMSADQTPSHFTVHIFINHDPSIASVFLPDLFSNFPESAWRLPQEYATPSRPVESPGKTPGNIPRHVLKELLTDPRKGLGRYIFNQPFPNSTKLGELSESLESEFDLHKKFLATFTIFPQQYLKDVTYSEWNGKPLSWNMTLAEVAMLDCHAVTMGQYSEVADQYAPVLHLVVETKSATLKRSLGGILGKHFLVQILGEKYSHQGDIWNRLESFIGCYEENWLPDIVVMLRRWRSAYHAVQYLKNDREILAAKREVDESALQSMTAKIEDFQRKKIKFKQSISVLANQWENWVLMQNYSTEDSVGNRELGDDKVEDKVQDVLGQRRVAGQWGNSGEKDSLRDMLQKAWSSKRNPTLGEHHHVDVLQSKNSEARTNRTEEPQRMISKEEEPEQASHQGRPTVIDIETIQFRSANGTISPKLANFTVKSGILSWGQILPIYYSSVQDKFTNSAESVPNSLSGGTIKQNVFTYKSAARVGDWKVRKYYSSWRAADPYDPDGEKQPAGWVICHDDIHPLEVLKKVRAINPESNAISNGNGHADKVSLSVLCPVILAFSLILHEECVVYWKV
jgi:hypothetical protein